MIKDRKYGEWYYHKGSQTLMIREPDQVDENAPEEIEGGDFSLLSYCVAALSENMAKRKNTFSITFFCGWYRDTTTGGRENINVFMLRALCYQLLDILGTSFDPYRYGYTDESFVQIREGRLSKLLQLFKDLVQTFARSGCTLVCFVDGVHVIEESEDEFNNFLRVCKSFKRLADHARDTESFTFNVMLTLPQQSHRDWQQLDGGNVVRLDLPAKKAKS